MAFSVVAFSVKPYFVNRKSQLPSQQCYPNSPRVKYGTLVILKHRRKCIRGK